MKTIFRILFFVFISCIIPVVSCDTASITADDAIYIGVLLPLTGPDGLPNFEALQFGVARINSGGGIGGKPVQLVFRDTRTGNLQTYAKELATDSRINLVIGPSTSDELFQISNLFVKNQKVLVSPSASSDEIFRAFAGTGNVWRLRTNDRDITSVIMQHLAAHDATSVAVLTPNNTYGKTFYDWIPFWAIESGIHLTGNMQYTGSDDISSSLHYLDLQNPDYIIFIYSGSNKDIITALKTLKADNSTSHLYLVQPHMNENGFIQEKSDSDTLLGALVSGQWELSDSSIISEALPDGTLVLMPPSSPQDFAKEYREYFGKEPSYSVPEVYDALLVSADIMARFSAYPGQSPMKAANTVLKNETGEIIPRSESGFQTAFDRIQNGEFPVMTGATGLLTFVPDGTDRKVPWFQTYQIINGEVTEEPVKFQEMSKKDLISEERFVLSNTTSDAMSITENSDLWAVIGGLSHEWSNYRHQADALTMYQILKENGVPDDHIILLIYDDIPLHPRNTKPGEVYHVPDLEEVRVSATVDYSQEKVNKKDIESVLTGTKLSPEDPVLGSDENATVLVYFASHGVEGGNLIIGQGEETISPSEFSEIIEKMKVNKKFGKMLVILESCFSGSLADTVSTPDVLVITASGKNETSKSDTYDSGLSNWISDEFTNKMTQIIREDFGAESISDLYAKTYRAVRSSHPGIYNYNNSFSLNTPVSAFFGG